VSYAVGPYGPVLSAATLEAVKEQPIPQLNAALWWWKLALFPVLAGILPMKEFYWGCLTWYRVIRGLRFVLLWIAVILISIGVYSFLTTPRG
jgi:hypothetical protein